MRNFSEKSVDALVIGLMLAVAGVLTSILFLA